MKVLVTGASSGIGREIARNLAPDCEKLVIVGRDVGRLEALRDELSQYKSLEVSVVAMDLTVNENCIRLHEEYSDIDLLINNAGMGDFGEFADTDLEKEIQMIDTNVKAMHILMKLYLKDMVERDQGQILNVASIAGFMPGPLMASYYATKSYVVRLSEAGKKELKKKKSNVKISILCPGPVATNFEKTANVGFNFNGAEVEKIAKYTTKHLNRFYIVPLFTFQISRFLIKIIPTSWTLEIVYRLQGRRVEK